MIWILLALLAIGIACEVYAFRTKIFGGKKKMYGRYTGRLMDDEKKQKVDYFTKRKKDLVRMWTSIILLSLFLVIANVVVGVTDASTASYEFQNKVHSHLENAYFANSPELMKTQLQECEQGMRELKLTSDMYGAFMPWDRVPNKQMAYQYQHIDSIIQRVDYVIEWRDAMYNNTTGIQPEQLGDVYNQKMDNLRSFIKAEGWSDWIAHDAYYTNHYMLLYIFSQLSVTLAVSLAIWLSFLVWSIWHNKEYMFDR